MIAESNVLKVPLEKRDIQELLNVKIIPEPLKDNVIYEGDSLDDFFIGYQKTRVGSKTSYKVTTKQVVLKNKGVNLPVRRNGRTEMPWAIDDWDFIPAKIVIVLEVKEEYFILEDQSTTVSLLVGVFKKEELEEYFNTGEGEVC